MATYDVFISYAHADIDVVKRIYGHLKRRRIRCFFDRENILGGEKYRKVERVSIEQSQKVLLVLSENCFEDGSIRKEIEIELKLASEFGKTIIPFVLDGICINDSVKRFLGDEEEGTSAIYVEKHPHLQYSQLLKAIKNGITPVNYIRDENAASFSLIEQMANEGNNDARIKMGDYFRLGTSIEIDYEKAIEWYEKAANENCEAVYSRLGECYLKDVKLLLKRCGYVANRLFIQTIPEIVLKAKAAEKWFLKTATSTTPDFNGLFDLFELEIWNYADFQLFELLPENDIYIAFEDLSPQSTNCDGYRLCRLLYRLTRINGIVASEDKENHSLLIDDNAVDVIDGKYEMAPEVIKASQTATRILQKWSDAGSVDAMLSLAGVCGSLRPESCDDETYKKFYGVEKAIKYLNRAYETIGDSLFKYDLSEYGVLDSWYPKDNPLSDALFNQTKPNMIGIQMLMHAAYGGDLSMCEDVVKKYCQNPTMQFYYLGLGALRVNLSFSAMWFTLSSKRGHVESKRLLGDFYAERIEIYHKGQKQKTGAIDNVIQQLEKGASSGDDAFDFWAGYRKEQGLDLRQAPKSDFLNLFLKNISKAVELYRDCEKEGKYVDLGRCYYWGLGLPKDVEKACLYGYTSNMAELEDADFRQWIKAIEEDYSQQEEAKAWAEEQECRYDYGEGKDDASINRSDETFDMDEENEWVKNQREAYLAKAEQWKSQFEDIPCPYDYIVKDYMD